MRLTSSLTLTTVLVAAAVSSSVSMAQMNLSNFKMPEPSRELPGDRAMSCPQIAAEMGEIMRKRDMRSKVASSTKKMCGSTRTLDKLGEERRALAATQIPALTSAAVVGGPVANAVTRKTQAQDAALEAKQRPERDRAMAGIGSGVGDMVSVFNDPRLMRLALLAQDKQCAESMAAAQKPVDTPASTACADVPADADVVPRGAGSGSSASAPAGADDPFAQRGGSPVKPTANDPFAKR